MALDLSHTTQQFMAMVLGWFGPELSNQPGCCSPHTTIAPSSINDPHKAMGLEDDWLRSSWKLLCDRVC